MNDMPCPVRLLVVDDDPVVIRLVCHALAGDGIRTVTAASGAGAREALAAESFDLLLLDVGLPDEDGYRLCRDLKADPAYRDLPVVFLTARAGDSEMLHGFDAGGVDYVVKPFDPRVLRARVATHATLGRLSRDLQSALTERTLSLQVAHRRMREMDSELALAAARERRALADQLHDTAIQQLVLARILLDRMTGESADAVPALAGRIKGLIDDSLAQLRSLVFDLSPPVLYQAGLLAALKWLAAQLGERWGIGYMCHQEGEPCPLPDDLRVTLFQGARELMNNAGRHARARRCEAVLSYEPHVLRLTVQDDGIGIDPDHAAVRPDAARGGFGLFSLRSRIGLLGGRLTLEALPTGGTRATLWVPLPPCPTTPAGPAGRERPGAVHASRNCAPFTPGPGPRA